MLFHDTASKIMKLNKTNVDAISLTDKGQAIHRDSELIGFAVRVTTKSKTYIVERRFKGELFRVIIGKTNEISALAARAKAQMLLAQIANDEIMIELKERIRNLRNVLVG